MKRGEVLSATARAERARATTKAAMARELAYAAILARLWPSYVMKLKPRTDSDKRWAKRLPWILGVQSPAGWLAWRLSPEEYESFRWVNERPHNGEPVDDRMPVLLMLADGSWTR